MSKKSVLIVITLLVFVLTAHAQERIDTLLTHSESLDSLQSSHTYKNPLNPFPALRDLRRDSTLNLREKLHESKNIFVRFFKAFDEFDTTYIEREKYHMTVMLQGEGTAEWFSLKGEETGHRLNFTSRPGYKITPYIGWHNFCLGYGLDVRSIGREKSKKTIFDFSFYTSLFGGDLYYRKTGSDFTLRKASGYDQSLDQYKGSAFDGIKVSMIGANLYYILNHRHFSLPAAFSQCTVQRKSCGTWKFGFSITHHGIDIDYEKLNEQIPGGVSSDMQVAKMRYMDYSISAGYAYNWVFARNWLFSIDMAPQLGYKRTSHTIWQTAEEEQKAAQEEGAATTANTQQEKKTYSYFYRRGNVNINVTARMGLVWNNNHHYAGAYLVLHNFNYRFEEVSMHNTFVECNVYVGLNFWRRKSK